MRPKWVLNLNLPRNEFDNLVLTCFNIAQSAFKITEINNFLNEQRRFKSSVTLV